MFPLLLAVTGAIKCAGPPGSYVTVVGWDGRGQSAFIRSCIEYNRFNGQFRVFQAGLYIVISRLAFSGPNDDLAVPQMYAQQVMRYNLSKAVVIDRQLRSTHGLARSNVPVHISEAIGVARLTADELLYVEAKPVHLLVRGNSHSSFSLVKLQNGQF